MIDNFENRIRKYNKIVKYLENVKIDNISTKKRITNKSKYGEVYLSKINTNIITIKIFPYFKNELHDTNDEVKYLKLITDSVIKYTTPNLPMTYNSIFSKCYFKNKEIYKSYLLKKTVNYHKCHILFNEYYEGSLFGLYKKNPYLFYNFEFIYSLYFQLLTATYNVNILLKILHNDIHTENILYYKVPKKTYIKYTIDNKLYIIPTYGYIFILWDYGLSEIINTKSIPINKDVIDILFTLLEQLQIKDLPLKNINSFHELYKFINNIKCTSFKEYYNSIFTFLYLNNKYLINFNKNLDKYKCYGNFNM